MPAQFIKVHLLIILVSGSLCVSIAEAEENAVIYSGATLIDGSGAAPRSDMSVLVYDQRIQAVFPVGETPNALIESARVVDVSGQFVLPGLIDAHTHLGLPPRTRSEDRLRRYVYSGVTAVRDLGGDGRLLADLSRSGLLNEIPSPDIYYSAFFAGRSFYMDPRAVASSLGKTAGEVPWMLAITTDTDMAIAVGMARGTGATGIKIYADLTPTLVSKISQEARRQGLQVWSHGTVFPAMPDDVVEGGINSISHVCLLAYQGSGVSPDRYHDFIQPEYASISQELNELLETMAQQEIILDPTLRVYKTREGVDQAGSLFPFICPTAYAYRLTRAAIESGVRIAAGTDGMTDLNDPYTALHEELELLSDGAGMSPMDVIQSATLIGARVLGMEDEFGTVTEGKLANLVFVSEDPTVDISNLRSVTLTVKRGTEYWRTEFDASNGH